MPESQKDIVEHYSRLYNEHERLASNFGHLERIRTERILMRYLPQPPAVILDVGGGTGAYAFPLAKKGYTVHLIDLTPAHVEKAKELSKSRPEHPLASINVGDARDLEFDDMCADVVLFFGPLYHLIEKNDRITALKEAYRVLKNDGLLFADGITRFASLLDGIDNGHIRNPDFVEIVKQDLKNGQHRNPKRNPDYFTTSFFHHPEELRSELIASGFTVEAVLAIEGPIVSSSYFDEFWQDETIRNHLFSFIEMIEDEPSLLGASPHIMSIGKKSQS